MQKRLSKIVTAVVTLAGLGLTLVRANVFLIGGGDTATLDLAGSPSSTGEVHAYYTGHWNSDDIPNKYDAVTVYLNIDGAPVTPTPMNQTTAVQTSGWPGTIINVDWHVPVGPGSYYSSTGHHTADFYVIKHNSDPPQPVTHYHLHDEWDQ